MKSALTLAVLAWTASPAQATTTEESVALSAPAATNPGEADAHRSVLARQFVDLLYPKDTREEAYLEELRTAWFSSLDAIEQPTIRAALRRDLESFMNKITPVVRARYPELMEGYAAAYASDYTADELRQLIAFASTPAGNRYLQDSHSAKFDAHMEAADAALMEALEPLADEMRTVMCKRATEVRVAQGEADAKCSRA